MFGCVAPRGPRCPLTQQCVERPTAGYNTSHLSCLSYMAVLASRRVLSIFLSPCLHHLLADSLSAPILPILPPHPELLPSLAHVEWRMIAISALPSIF